MVTASLLTVTLTAALTATTGAPAMAVAPPATPATPAPAAALAQAPGGAAPAATCPSAPFPDVSAASTFCSDIAWLATTGVTGGYGDGTFRPTTVVSRQTMAAFLHRYGFSGGPDPACAGPTRLFPDVSTGGFCGSIEWLAGAGITGGYGDGTFRPTAVVSRQSMAAFLYRFAHPGEPLPACTASPFPDVPASHAFCREVTWLAGSGITGGFGDGTFRPTAPVSRQSMAAFLHRAHSTGAIELGTAVALPTVTAVTPAAGPTDGGTTVTVTGTGLTGATELILDLPSASAPVPATNLTVVSDTTLTAKTVAHDAGTVPVRVITPRGTSVPNAARFTYRSDWTQPRHDAAHTGWNPVETVITPANAAAVAQEWSVAGGGPTAVADGVLYVASTGATGGDGLLTAYNLATGADLWSISTGTCTGSSLAITADLVIVGCSAPRAYQRGGTHQLVWDIALTDPGQSVTYLQTVGHYLLAWSNDHLAAFQPSDGQRIWQQLLPSGASTLWDVAATDSTVVVAYDDRLRGLSLATGAQQWSRTDYAAFGFTQLVIAGGWVYTNGGGGVSRYSLAAGSPGWSVRPDGNIYRIEAADADTVYVWEAVFDFSAPYPSVLHALRTSNGSQRWQFDVPSRIGQVAIAGNVVWLTSSGIYSQEHASGLIALNRSTGAQLRRLSFEDNMYGAGAASFAGGKVVIDQGGSFGDPQPRRIRVFGLSGRVPDITSSALPLGRVGEAYSADLSASPSGATWSLASGTLPAGITLSASGQLRGTPTVSGTSRITVRATGVNGRARQLSLPLQVVTAGTSAWTNPGRDATRNPVTAGDGSIDLGNAATLGYRWKTVTPGASVTGGDQDVVTSGSRMYATSWDGTLRAFDLGGNATNRTPAWTATGQFTGPPLLAGDRLIARTTDGMVHGIRLTDGADLWATADPVPGPTGNVAGLVVGNMFFMPTNSSAVQAYSTIDGGIAWAQPSTAQTIYWGLASDGVRIYGVSDCDLVALQISDGAELWRTPVSASGVDCGAVWTNSGPPVVADGKVYAATSNDRLVADAATGTPLLRFAASSYGAGFGAVAGGLWVFPVTGLSAGAPNQLVAVDAVTGRVAWKGADVSGDARLSVVGDLVVATTPYTVQGFSRLTGELVWDGGSLSGVGGTPVIAGNRILVNAVDGVRAYGPL